jgi:translation initiation factor IF-3
LDLVEISPNATPPVCKIMDYGRYKFKLTKKKQEAKKKQAIVQIKEIKVRPKTSDHDLKTKIGHIHKFIGKKDKVKITVVFRGREIALSQLAKKVLDKIVEETADIAAIELHPKFEGRVMYMILTPK